MGRDGEEKTENRERKEGGGYRGERIGIEG